MALVVFTGGARSGKSAAARRLAATRAIDGAQVVVAVFGREAGDPEFAERIARHRLDRPEDFSTIEAVDSRTWLERVDSDALLVVDCLGTLVGGVLEEEWGKRGAGSFPEAPAAALPPGYQEAVAVSCAGIIDALCARPGDTIVVTNEVGDGVVPAFATGRLFRDLLGTCNRRLIDASDASYLVIAGRLLRLDDLRFDARWPED